MACVNGQTDRYMRRRLMQDMDEIERLEMNIEEMKAMEGCPPSRLARTEQRLAHMIEDYELVKKKFPKALEAGESAGGGGA